MNSIDPIMSDPVSIPEVGEGKRRPPYRLRRAKRGVRRIERSDSWYGGWIARGVDGYRLPLGDDFEWRTRSAAWHVCLEDDIFSGPEERAQTPPAHPLTETGL